MGRSETESLREAAADSSNGKTVQFEVTVVGEEKREGEQMEVGIVFR